MTVFKAEILNLPCIRALDLSTPIKYFKYFLLGSLPLDMSSHINLATAY